MAGYYVERYSRPADVAQRDSIPQACSAGQTKISPFALVNWHPGAAAEHRLPSTRVWTTSLNQRTCDTSSHRRATCRKLTRHHWHGNLGKISIVLNVDKINRSSTNMKDSGYDNRTAPPTPISRKPKKTN